MSRYIDADALIERVTGNGLKPITEQIFHKLIDDAPTIDAVSVVRCKECKHWNEEDHWCNIRDSYGWDYKADDFCSYGEPKEELKGSERLVKGSEQTDCQTCKWGEWYRQGYDITMMDDECGGCCSWNSKWTPKDEPQTEPLQTCSVNGRPYDCGKCEYFRCTADEPQTKRSSE